MCVIDDSNEHMLTVWDWQKKSKVAEIKVNITQMPILKYKCFCSQKYNNFVRHKFDLGTNCVILLGFIRAQKKCVLNLYIGRVLNIGTHN